MIAPISTIGIPLRKSCAFIFFAALTAFGTPTDVSDRRISKFICVKNLPLIGISTSKFPKPNPLVFREALNAMLLSKFIPAPIRIPLFEKARNF